ncbi:hypothetical protein INR49_001347 [Caranx melampygus]|nr:hypothetical protein INR49_001347 [Caranx melampygus]
MARDCLQREQNKDAFDLDRGSMLRDGFKQEIEWMVGSTKHRTTPRIIHHLTICRYYGASAEAVPVMFNE